MKWVPEKFSLPLLTKDLIEQSARPRLYVIRVIYVGILMILAGYVTSRLLSVVEQLTPIALLGLGKQIFQWLIFFQFAGIYLFLPSFCCGAIAAEKERNTISLLFLTKLGPWTIIFEKLGSRCTLMATLLLTSLPLLAFTQALGGIDILDLFSGVWFLTLSAVLVASISIFASAFFRTTVSAFSAACLMLLVLSTVPFFVDVQLLDGMISETYIAFADRYLGWMLLDETVPLELFLQFMWFPPVLFVAFAQSAIVDFSTAIALVALSSLPSLLTAGLAIWGAKMCLVPRAFAPGPNSLPNFFKLVDSWLQALNHRLARGLIVVKETHSLPEDRPIAWRETTRRWLGQFRCLVRILVVLELPILYLGLLTSNVRLHNDPKPALMVVISFSLWIITALLVTRQASTLVTEERVRETLDVLLTTPIPGRQIILEKMSAITRLITVCTIPLLTCLIFQTWWAYEAQVSAPNSNSEEILQQSFGLRSQRFVWHEYLFTVIVTLVVNLNFMAWLGLWIGIRSKSPGKAILASLGILTAWCIVPLFPSSSLNDLMWIVANILEVEGRYFSFIKLAILSSPAALIGFLLEPDGLYMLCPIPYLPAFTNALIYGSLWFLIRRRVLRFANVYLGRGNLRGPSAPVALEFEPQGATVRLEGTA